MTIIRRILKTAWNEFIYGGHLQCLGVAGIAYISTFLLNIESSWEIPLLSYLISYPIYIHDRLKGIRSDKVTNPERTNYFEKYIYVLQKTIILAIFAIIVLIIYIGNPVIFTVSLILLSMGLIYPIYLKDLTKKIIAFKNFYVSVSFTAIIGLSVIYHFNEIDHSLRPLAIFALFVFVKSMMMQVFLDCKDVESDKLFGLLTIPVLIGKDKTLKILKVSSFISFLLILIPGLFFIENLPNEMLILGLAIPLNFYSYHLSSKNNYSGYIWGSSELILWFLLIVLIKIA